MIFAKVYWVSNNMELEGEITWDGEKLKPSSDDEAIDIVLGRPLFVPDGNGNIIKIDPNTEPEKFIKNAYLQYKSYRLRVGSAQER